MEDGARYIKLSIQNDIWAHDSLIFLNICAREFFNIKLGTKLYICCRLGRH